MSDDDYGYRSAQVQADVMRWIAKLFMWWVIAMGAPIVLGVAVLLLCQ